jgi:uncharacterized protein YidB (DUF937 family)
MFDFGKITEALGGLFSNSQAQVPSDVGGIMELLSNAGIDPSLLDGLNQDEILGLLQQHGIDTSLLDPSQLTELMQGNVSGSLGEMAQSWLSSRQS